MDQAAVDYLKAAIKCQIPDRVIPDTLKAFCSSKVKALKNRIQVVQSSQKESLAGLKNGELDAALAVINRRKRRMIMLDEIIISLKSSSPILKEHMSLLVQIIQGNWDNALIENVESSTVIPPKEGNLEIEELNIQLKNILSISNGSTSTTKTSFSSKNAALIRSTGPEKHVSTNLNDDQQKDKKKAPLRKHFNPVSKKVGANFDVQSPYAKDFKLPSIKSATKSVKSSTIPIGGVKKKLPQKQLLFTNYPKLSHIAVNNDKKTIEEKRRLEALERAREHELEAAQRIEEQRLKMLDEYEKELKKNKEKEQIEEKRRLEALERAREHELEAAQRIEEQRLKMLDEYEKELKKNKEKEQLTQQKKWINDEIECHKQAINRLETYRETLDTQAPTQEDALKRI